MPTIERRSIPQSLSAVATKGRKLFSRESSIFGNDHHGSGSGSPLQTSRQFSQGQVAPPPSAYCLSSELLSPPLEQERSFGKETGRRRSSNTTVSSCNSHTNSEDPHRRRRSLFSKKFKTNANQNIEPSAPCEVGTRRDKFIDPFSPPSSEGPKQIPSFTKTERARWQTEQKLAALDRVSDLVCLSIEKQSEQGNQPSLGSSPPVASSSPTLCEDYFYPLESPPSPLSQSYSKMNAFPHSQKSHSIYQHRSEVFDIVTPFTRCGTKIQASDLHQDAVLLPSAMKSRGREAERRNMTEPKSFPTTKRTERATSYHFPSFQMPGEPRRREPSLLPPPPLRPSRHPLRARAQSLSAANHRKQGSSSKRDGSDPTSPLPKGPKSDEPPQPDNFDFLRTPPRSRPSSGHRRHGSRCDSTSSVSSNQPAPFHTPTFGASGKWTTLPC